MSQEWAAGRWAPSKPPGRHWAIPWQDYRNTMPSPHWQQRNTPLKETVLWDGANALQTMGTVDTSWWSGGWSVPRTLSDFSRKTLGPWRNSVSGAEPGSRMEEGIGLAREAEALQPGEAEESNPIGAPGSGEEGMNFQGHGNQEAYESQRRLECWLQYDPMRRDSPLGNQVLTDTVFLGREMVGTDCEENFRQRSDLSRSRPAKSQKETYICSECGKSFAYKSYLIRHEHSHTGRKPYTCLECGKSFSRSTYLASHERAHTGEKPYICSVCGKGFLARNNLLLHQNIHTGEKPHRCMECDKSFLWNSQLVAHSATHGAEEPFKCLECGQNFSWKSGLRKHMKSHNRKEPQTSAHCGES